MTAQEYSALVAAGKIKPASIQKRKATKRKALEDQSTVNSSGTGFVQLVRIEKEYQDGCKVIHHIHPLLESIIQKIKTLP